MTTPATAPPLTLEATDMIAPLVGIRFNGEEQGKRVLAYSVPEGWIEVGQADHYGRHVTGPNDLRLVVRLHGVVEPFWRPNPSNREARRKARARGLY